ncbi:hypothetical protein FRC03_000758 [Tulasnella sp. 419]|nr:hypothetical protein FRC03_000758 [Tulasnella sp. 419]
MQLDSTSRRQTNRTKLSVFQSKPPSITTSSVNASAHHTLVLSSKMLFLIKALATALVATASHCPRNAATCNGKPIPEISPSPLSFTLSLHRPLTTR